MFSKFQPFLFVTFIYSCSFWSLQGNTIRHLRKSQCTVTRGNCNLLEAARIRRVESFCKSSLTRCIVSSLVLGLPIPPLWSRFPVFQNDCSCLIISEQCEGNICIIRQIKRWCQFYGQSLMVIRQNLSFFLNCEYHNPKCTCWASIFLSKLENEIQILGNKPWWFLNMCF